MSTLSGDENPPKPKGLQRRIVIHAVLVMLATTLGLFICFYLFDMFWGRRSATPNRLQVFEFFDIRPSSKNGTIGGGANRTTLGGQVKSVSIWGAVIQAVRKSFTIKVLLAFTVFVLVLAAAFTVFWTTVDHVIMLPPDPEDPGPDFIYPPDEEDPEELQRKVLLPLLAFLVVFVVLVVAGKMFGWADRRGVFTVGEGEGSFVVQSGEAKVVIPKKPAPAEGEKKETGPIPFSDRVKLFFTNDIPTLSTPPSNPNAFVPEYYKFDTEAPSVPALIEPKKQNPYTQGPEVKYERGDKLGNGSFGQVYAAVRVDSDGTRTPVAIKEIDLSNYIAKREKDGTATTEERLMRQEAGLMNHFGDLDDKHFVRFLDYYEHGQKLYIVMELLQGKTLNNYKNMSLPELSVVLRELLLAVQTIHAAGWRHRDIKRENVFITTDGNVKLMDFGLSGPVGDSTPCGSEGHMPVELTHKNLTKAFRDTPNDLTTADKYEILSKCAQHEAVDIYSLGSLLRNAYIYNDDQDFNELTFMMRSEQPWRRPTASSLLKHPFITKHKDETLSSSVKI